jgi:hypothetical protein
MGARNPLGKVWDNKIMLSDIFHSETMSFTEQRDAVVTRLRAMPLYQRRVEGSVVLKEHDRLVDVIESLAQSDDEEEFNSYMDDLYDWGDEGKRLWIEAF